MMLETICPMSPDFHIDWDFINGQFDWFRELESCKQDPIWHAEGNVQTHTKMVCHALVEQPEWLRLEAADRNAMFLAALFHDVAKPITTQIIAGRLRAPNHAMRGSYVCREQLLKHILQTDSVESLRQRELVTQLVRFHGIPLNIFDKPDPIRKLHRLSLHVNNRLLALIAKADVLGRQCEDQSQILVRIEMFEELCRENCCWDAARKFANDNVRMMYFQGKDVSPDAEISAPNNGTATILSGLPGSGKDFWIKSNRPQQTVVSLDQIRRQLKINPGENQGVVGSTAKERCKEIMRQRKDFVFNATNVSRRVRQLWCGLFSNYGYRIETVYVESNWEKILERNAKRRDAIQVPHSVLNKLVGKMDLPYLDEAHHVQWVTN